MTLRLSLHAMVGLVSVIPSWSLVARSVKRRIIQRWKSVFHTLLGHGTAGYAVLVHINQQWRTHTLHCHFQSTWDTRFQQLCVSGIATGPEANRDASCTRRDGAHFLILQCEFCWVIFLTVVDAPLWPGHIPVVNERQQGQSKRERRAKWTSCECQRGDEKCSWGEALKTYESVLVLVSV